MSVYPRSSKKGTPRVPHQDAIQMLIDSAILDYKVKHLRDGVYSVIVGPGISGIIGDGVSDDTIAIQTVIDNAVASAGGVGVDVWVAPNAFKVSPGVNRYCLKLGSNIRLHGVKNFSRLVVDSSLVLDSGRVVHVIELGDTNTGVNNVTIEDIRIDGNHSVVGTPVGAYIQGIQARHDTTPLAHSDNITVSNCVINDTNIAVGAVKNTGTAAADTDRLAAQHQNWRVDNCTIATTNNKAVEFQETNGGWISNNFITGCEDGPQAINFARNIIIDKNKIYYNGTGINVTEGASYIDVLNNHLTCMSATKGYGGITLRREPYTNATAMSHILVQGNTVIDSVSPSKKGFVFQTRSQNTGSSTFTDVRIIDNTFDSKVYLYDTDYPSKSAAVDVYVSGNRFGSTCDTSSAWASSTTRVMDNVFTNAHAANADGWTYKGNTFKAGITIVAARVSVGYATPVRTRGGSYYLPPGSAGVQTVAVVDGRIVYVPIIVDTDTVIDQLGFEITIAGAAGSVIRLGVYSDNGGQPGSLIAETTSTFDGTQVAGFYQQPITATLLAGTSWLAYKTEGAPASHPTVRAHLGRLRPIQWNAGSGFAATLYNGALQTGVSVGALPSNAGANSVVANAPVVLARAV
jgi:hypothetical protein